MKKVTINENQKGFLFKNGKYTALLGAGKYYECFGRSIEIVPRDLPMKSAYCPTETLLADRDVQKEVISFEVGDRQMALYFAGGRFMQSFLSGKHAVWKSADEQTVQIVELSEPLANGTVPEYILCHLAEHTNRCTKYEVADSQKAVVFYNGAFKMLLDAGSYYFWNTETKVTVEYIDTRLLQMELTGQEMLTADKVAVRVNFVCFYRVTDFLKIVTEIDDYKQQMHVACQLALREYIGGHKLDGILENKEALSRFVFDKLKSRESNFYAEIKEAGVKDIILPGEIREIMNTVLIAEKQAQANVITRREEVASTRSLLNTAKLMDENQTLYKLKELEFVERICENVGNITLNGNGGVLSQLTGLLRYEKG